jgi:hypothetical protein
MRGGVITFIRMDWVSRASVWAVKVGPEMSPRPLSLIPGYEHIPKSLWERSVLFNKSVQSFSRFLAVFSTTGATAHKTARISRTFTVSFCRLPAAHTTVPTIPIPSTRHPAMHYPSVGHPYRTRAAVELGQEGNGMGDRRGSISDFFFFRSGIHLSHRLSRRMTPTSAGGATRGSDVM